MIERLQRIATHLHRFRLLFGAIAVVATAVLLLSVIDNPWITGDSLLIPAILGLIWAVTLISFAQLLVQIPQPPAADAGWRARLSYRIRRAGAGLLALVTLVVCLMVLVLTYQLLRVGAVG